MPTIEVDKDEFEGLQRRISKLRDDREKAIAALVDMIFFVCETTPMQFTEDHAEETGYTKGDEHSPFFSESFLYVLIGKEDARSILYRISHMAEALGLDRIKYHDRLRDEYERRFRGGAKIIPSSYDERDAYIAAAREAGLNPMLVGERMLKKNGTLQVRDLNASDFRAVEQVCEKVGVAMETTWVRFLSNYDLELMEEKANERN